MILARFWEWWATWERKWRWFPRWQGHRTTPKRKTEQKPINQKEKEKGQKPGCYKPSPLKEISSSRLGAQRTSMSWGHRFQLGYPCSFIYCSPKNFITSTYLVVGWFASPFSKFWWVFAHTPNPFADIDSFISAVISNEYEYKFSFGHENLFTSAMRLLQINAGLLVSINAGINHGHLLTESDCS